MKKKYQTILLFLNKYLNIVFNYNMNNIKITKIENLYKNNPLQTQLKMKILSFLGYLKIDKFTL